MFRTLTHTLLSLLSPGFFYGQEKKKGGRF
jgi:hypothetical protein